MSRPFQFTDKDDIPNSPLDRRQQIQPAGQAPSFKTNVNRAKTKKWVEAKQVSYGGDDWDDYDEDDEYGVQSAIEERPPPVPSSQNRSFTNPIPGSVQATGLQRKNSFERGDERRAFSSSAQPAPAAPRSPGPPLHLDTGVPAHQAQSSEASASQYSQSAGARQASSASFTPSVTSNDSVNPENRRDFSPTAMPPPLNTPAAAQTPLSPASAAKRAFVRPSDIYKRMEEEREKERRSSLDESRRSTESGRSQDPPAPAPVPEPVYVPPQSSYRMGAPLETVEERKSEYGLPGITTSGDSSKPGFQLPSFESGSSFGSFWDEAARAKEAEKAASNTPESALQHQPSVGYRSMVHQAFDASGNIRKQDSTRSLAPTETSGLTRSDTSGTSDISPIVSRMPSTAVKQAEHPAAIAEEPESEERGRAYGIPADIQPGFRRSLDPPSGTNSPARSPAVELRNPLRDPITAELLTSPESDKAAKASFREADLAATAASGSNLGSTPVANLEKAAQDGFVVTHGLAAEATPRISRSESPTKGHVADLAGKFNESATESRRNSQQSLGSRKSASSLKESSSRPSNSHGTKVVERPIAEREISFRPKLPGGYESFGSTTGNTPTPPTGASTPSETEISPTTTSKTLHGNTMSSQQTSSGGPMAALVAAGAAIAASIQGTGAKTVNDDTDGSKPHERTRGDIYNRPLPPDRMESEAPSSVAPTPLPKDDPIVAASSITKDLPKSPALQHRDTTETAVTNEDFESDRIRRDIVRSLSPTDEKPIASSGLAAPDSRAPNRQSKNILSEYESYWAGSDDEDGEPKLSATALPPFDPAPLPLKPTKSVEVQSEKQIPQPMVDDSAQKQLPMAPIATTALSVPTALTDSPASARPGFLTQRFSWEMTPADSPVKEAAQPQLKPAEHTPASSAAPTTAETKLQADDPLSLNPKLSSEHLQIRNAEPGELPEPEEFQRPSLDAIREVTPQPIEDNPASTAPMSPVSPMVPATTREVPAGPRPISRDTPAGSRPLSGGHDVRPPSFREILAIKSTELRIAKYNETRIQFANLDTGLEHWLRAMTATNLSLRDLNNPLHRPTVPPTTTTSSPGGARHKATASLTKVFSGQGDKLSSPMDSRPEHRPSPSSGERTSAAALKGKELIGKAGVLGQKGLGKGMKEAKGLFAKGKSRFRTSGSEKVYPSSDSSLSRRSSIASSTSSSQSSIFSAPDSRRSSFDATLPSDVPVLFDVSMPSEIWSIADQEAEIFSVKKERDLSDPLDQIGDDDHDHEPFWSDSWLRENVDFTIMMGLFNRKKGDKPVFGQPDEEEDPELAANTRMNSARPSTPSQANQPFIKMGGEVSSAPALPTFVFEGKPGSRPSSRGGLPLPEPPPKAGIMKHSNGSSGGLVVPGGGVAGRSISSPLAGGAGTGPAQKLADKIAPRRIVSMLPPDSGDEDDPPSPVSPVDEDRPSFPPKGVNGKDALGRSGDLRAVSSQSRLPQLNTGLAPTISMGSPALRPNSHIGISGMVTPTRSKVSFAPPEPKGKEKAVSGAETPIEKKKGHIRFDSSTFPKNDKEEPGKGGKPGKSGKPGKGDKKMDKTSKKDEDKQSGGKPKFGPGLIIPKFGGGRGRGRGKPDEPVDTDTLSPLQPPPGRGRGRSSSGASTPTGRGNLAPPSAMKQTSRSQPESGSLGGLHRANSQFDRMAAIANAHRMMREQFDEMNSVAEPPPDLAASENAARSAAQERERKSNGLGIPSIPEERPGSSSSMPSGRSRASSNASYQDERSRSREGRSKGPVSHRAEDSRSSSMPRQLLPGARSGSIPRPESIVISGRESPLQDPRRQSWGTGAAPSASNIGVAISTNVLSISKGQGPPTPVTQSNLNSLHSQQQHIYGTSSPHGARLSAGPGPTIRDGSPGRMSTPSMIITSPDNVSPPRKADPRFSTSQQSQYTVSSVTESNDKSSERQSADDRHYKAPDAQKERPMSYVMAQRDDRGFVSERISTGRKNNDPAEAAYSDAEEEPHATPGAPKSVNDQALNRLIGEGSDRGSGSGQTSRTSMRSEDDELYRQPSPKMTPVASNEVSKKSTADSLTFNPAGKHRSIQLYDRPFSRDESASGTSTPSQRSQTPAQSATDTTSNGSVQNTPVSATAGNKGGLLAKLKKPGGSAVAANSPHSQNSSRDTTNTSSEDQRLSSMTSTTASIQSKKRGSGFFSLKRSSSTEPVTVHDENTVIPPHNQVRVNTNVAVAASPTSSTASTPRRSATSVESAKKRRGTLSHIFGRNGSEKSAQVPAVPEQKQSAKNTIFHKVSAGASVSTAPREFKGPQSQRSSDQSQGSRPPSTGSRPISAANRPGSFEHKPGASGMAAIVAQGGSSYSASISSDTTQKERRSMSLSGGGGLFGRKRTDSSPASRSRDRSNSVESTTKLKKARKWGSKGSLSEGLQHQERPWAITLPGADEDERSKEIERQEILQAATTRRQRGTDGQLYPMTEQSPSNSAPSSTPISPQAQAISPQVQSSQTRGGSVVSLNAPQASTGKSGQVYHIQSRPPLPTNVSQPGQVYHMGPRPSPPATNQTGQVYHMGPRPSPPVPQSQGQAAPTVGRENSQYNKPNIGPPPQQRYPPPPRRLGHYTDEENASYQTQSAAAFAAVVGAVPSQPIIPPLPQNTVPIMQPIPRRTSQHSGVNDPRMDPSYRSQGASRSATNTANMPNSPHTTMHHYNGVSSGQGRPTDYFNNRMPSQDQRMPSSPNGQYANDGQRPSVTTKDQPELTPRTSSRSSESEGAADSTNFVAALEAERRRHGEHTAMGARKRSPVGNLQLNVPVTNSAPPPQVGVFSDETSAIAAAGLNPSRSQRQKHDESDPDSAPVMKATSFPGDEWIPEFYD